MVKNIEDKKWVFMLTNNLFWSEAYQILKPSSQRLLWCFYSELRFTGSRNKETFKYINNGEISFSEREFKFNKLGNSQTYLTARNQLIEVGFIKITYRGGMGRGDSNKYRLLFVQGVRHEHMRWKRYPKENWKREIPKAKDTLVGVRTRFKKKSSTLKR